MTAQTKNRPTQQALAVDAQLAELERHRGDHSASVATALAERPAAEAKHAACVLELEAAKLEFSQHRADHRQSDEYVDAEGTRRFLMRPSTPARDAALAQVERVLHAQLDEHLEAERLARVACNDLNRRIGHHQSALGYVVDQLGQARGKREAQLATHAAANSTSTLARIRDSLSALMQGPPEEADVRKLRLKETFWYVADHSAVVGDGDGRAASLLGRAGTSIEIDRREAERLGIA